jgi:hypothetical protein
MASLTIAGSVVRMVRERTYNSKEDDPPRSQLSSFLSTKLSSHLHTLNIFMT